MLQMKRCNENSSGPCHSQNISASIARRYIAPSQTCARQTARRSMATVCSLSRARATVSQVRQAVAWEGAIIRMTLGMKSLVVALVTLVALSLCGGCASCSHRGGVAHAYAEPEISVPRKFFFKEVGNFRDIGGRRGEGGRLLKSGKIYRSAAFNHVWKWYRCERARNYLTDETRDYIVQTLGVKTDIDLRTERNCRGMEQSPLGPQVRFTNIPSKAYEGLGSDDGKKAFGLVFRECLDPANYPMVIHCAAGNDRAGSAIYILEALLGVAEVELENDWSVSNIWRNEPLAQEKLQALRTVFDDFPGESLNERVENYVLSLGFSRDDIARFKELMLR